jgi:hypothetical protein
MKSQCEVPKSLPHQRLGEKMMVMLSSSTQVIWRTDAVYI